MEYNKKLLGGVEPCYINRYTEREKSEKMNFEQIKTFLSVAKTGNFSLTAKERFLTQPTISNQIRQLEKELDSQLFYRSSQNVFLTEQGERFYRYANKLLAVEKDIYTDIKERQKNYYGTFDIAAPHLQTDRQLGGFLNRVIEEQKEGVTYRIVEHEDEKISEKVLYGEVELGVCSVVNENYQLVYEKVFVEEIYLITPDEARYRELDSRELRRLLLEERHIRFDFGQGSDFLWNDFFGKTIGVNLHDVRTAARCSNYNLVLDAVMAGKGIAFMSNTIMQREWKAGKILAYRCRGLLEKPFYIVYDRERAEKSEVICHARDILKEELKKTIDFPDKSF